MSIHLTVGVWLGPPNQHTEFAAFVSEQLDLLDQILTQYDLSPHHEPVNHAIDPLFLTITRDMFPLRDMAYAVEQVSPLRFPHLLLQSGNEGIYLPRAFAQPLSISAASPLLGTVIGSSAALQQECALLARLFGRYEEIVPLEERQESSILFDWHTLASQFNTAEEWTPAVSGCQKLYTAASYSQKIGCALFMY